MQIQVLSVGIVQGSEQTRQRLNTTVCLMLNLSEHTSGLEIIDLHECHSRNVGGEG